MCHPELVEGPDSRFQIQDYRSVILSKAKHLVGVLFLSIITISCAQDSNVVQVPQPKLPPYLIDYDTTWVDSIFHEMTFEEKLGQLFMPFAYSKKGQEHIDEQIELVQKYHIGGFIWMQGTPRKQIEYYNQLQKASKYPLMFSIDAERGLAMRLDSTHQFPYEMTMGALESDSLIYDMGRECAIHCRKLGAHINFAPVVDVNNNPNNPIINIRAFGSDRERVAKNGIAYMNGLQDNRVLACAKHFPGHGDTDMDSHLSLPIIKHDSSRLDSIELYPFKELFFQGCGSVMAAHLHIPTYDSTKNKASSLSKNVVTTLLKEEMKFEGLSFTDALNMKGVSKYYGEGEVELEALRAGNDVLLFSTDIPKAIDVIKKAIMDSVIDSSLVEDKAYKILKLKSWLQIEDQITYDEELLTSVDGDSVSLAINQQIYEQSIYWDRMDSTVADAEVIEIECKSKFPYRNYGLKEDFVAKTNAEIKGENVVIVLYGSPYAVAKFSEAKHVLVAAKKNDWTKTRVKEILAGEDKAVGKKPI